MGGSSSKPKESILKAVLDGTLDQKLLQTYLEKGYNVNEVDKYGETPLMKAAKKGDLATLRLLVEKGKAELSFVDKTWCRTALMWATWMGKVSCVKYLVELDRQFSNTPLIPLPVSASSQPSLGPSYIEQFFVNVAEYAMTAAGKEYPDAKQRRQTLPAPTRKPPQPPTPHRGSVFLDRKTPGHTLTTADYLEMVDKSDRTPLLLAAHQSHYALIRYFLFENPRYPISLEILKKGVKNAPQKQTRELFTLALGDYRANLILKGEKKNRKIQLLHDGVKVVKEAGFFSSRVEKLYRWNSTTMFYLDPKNSQNLIFHLEPEVQVIIELTDAKGMKAYLDNFVTSIFPSHRSKLWTEEYCERVNTYVAGMEAIHKEEIAFQEKKALLADTETKLRQFVAAEQYEEAAKAKAQKERTIEDLKILEEKIISRGVEGQPDVPDQKSKRKLSDAKTVTVQSPLDGMEVLSKLETERINMQDQIHPLSLQEMEFKAAEQYDKAALYKAARENLEMHIAAVIQYMERIRQSMTRVDNPVPLVKKSTNPFDPAYSQPAMGTTSEQEIVSPPLSLSPPPAFNPEAEILAQRQQELPYVEGVPSYNPHLSHLQQIDEQKALHESLKVNNKSLQLPSQSEVQPAVWTPLVYASSSKPSSIISSSSSSSISNSFAVPVTYPAYSSSSFVSSSISTPKIAPSSSVSVSSSSSSSLSLSQSISSTSSISHSHLYPVLNNPLSVPSYIPEGQIEGYSQKQQQQPGEQHHIGGEPDIYEPGQEEDEGHEGIIEGGGQPQIEGVLNSNPPKHNVLPLPLPQQPRPQLQSPLKQQQQPQQQQQPEKQPEKQQVIEASPSFDSKEILEDKKLVDERARALLEKLQKEIQNHNSLSMSSSSVSESVIPSVVAVDEEKKYSMLNGSEQPGIVVPRTEPEKEKELNEPKPKKNIPKSKVKKNQGKVVVLS